MIYSIYSVLSASLIRITDVGEVGVDKYVARSV